MARHDKSEIGGVTLTALVDLIGEVRRNHGKRWPYVKRRVFNDIAARAVRGRSLHLKTAMLELAGEAPTPAAAATIIAAFFDRS